jgi:membrane associated rhomboid family serine protease
MSDQYKPTGFRLLPTVVKNLLILNGLMFLAQIVAETTLRVRLSDFLGLHYPLASDFKPWQFVTYMFLHGSFGHIFFNMFALWMFGYMLENIWGPRRFLIYYLVTGIGAGLFHYFFIFMEVNPLVSAINAVVADPSAESMLAFAQSHTFQIGQNSGAILNQFRDFQVTVQELAFNPENREALQSGVNFLVDYREYVMNLPNVIGASGAVFGILLAFGMLFPNVRIYIYFLFPIKAKYFVILYGAAELIFGITGTADNIAHFAHLGGMLFGFFLIRYWKRKGNLY